MNTKHKFRFDLNPKNFEIILPIVHSFCESLANNSVMTTILDSCVPSNPFKIPAVLLRIFSHVLYIKSRTTRMVMGTLSRCFNQNAVNVCIVIMHFQFSRINVACFCLFSIFTDFFLKNCLKTGPIAWFLYWTRFLWLGF